MKLLLLYFIALFTSIALSRKVKSGFLNFLSRTIYRLMSLGFFIFISSKISLKISFFLINLLISTSNKYYSLMSTFMYLGLLSFGLILSFMATIKIEYLLIDGENKNVFNDLIKYRKK